MTVRAVRVFGHPAPKGSLKCVGRGTRHQLVEDNAKTKPWRELVTTAGPHLQLDGQPWEGPVAVHLTFTVARPKTVKRPFPHTHGSGDADKLARTVLDALEDAAVLTNDAQVCVVTSAKAYPDSPNIGQLDRVGVIIQITDDLGTDE